MNQVLQQLERRNQETDADVVDRMPPDLRAVVHEYGLSTVRAFYMHGIRKPSAMRHLIHSTLIGAREPGNRKPGAGNGCSLEAQLDMLLIRSGSTASARTILRELYMSGFAILPLYPSIDMLAASLATVAGHDVTVTKTEKHKRRLSAALRAGCRGFWPWLSSDA